MKTRVTKKDLLAMEEARKRQAEEEKAKKANFIASQPVYLSDMLSIRDSLSSLTKDIIAKTTVDSPELSLQISQISKLFPLIIQCNKLIQEKEVDDRLASDAEMSRQTIVDILTKADQLRKSQ